MKNWQTRSSQSIFELYIDKELKRIRLNRRLKEIADSVMDQRDRKCKYTYLFIKIPYI